ncbi:hypothetical protein [Alicyclobacillus tolerans]|uniref:Asp23 family, cell envelope-related function n=1 Tax=Alicyclobacillus tolerans TaxID=90970 RepID=A0A1M6NEB3_9BACL|nr:hypothetical protein [Alicyclobacillus montanus]SHJ93916.1 hypothetical protein SAMN05443507_10612 [Alicyclobacillus montanus]
MKLYGLYGRSGTGKSHHAQWIAQKMNIECILDDGVMIYKGVLKAGYSAKLEKTMIDAVRRAIFMDTLHCQEVRSALLKYNPSKCLILGTSQRMIERICFRLGLNINEIKWISIDEIVNIEEKLLALEMRQKGLHAVPIFQSKLQAESRIASYAIKMLNRIKVSHHLKKTDEEFTVVRPIFAEGGVYIHPQAVSQSIHHLIEFHQYPFHMTRMVVLNHDLSHFHIKLHAKWQNDLRKESMRLQQHIFNFLQEKLGFPYPNIVIEIVSISPPTHMT